MREPQEFNKYNTLYTGTAKDKFIYFANSGPAEETDYEPQDSGQWWLHVGTDDWYSVTNIREQFGEPKPGVIRPRPDWEDDE